MEGLLLKISTIITSSYYIVNIFLNRYLGGLDDFLYVLLIFIVVNYCTGIMCTFNEHKLSSQAIFRELTRKALILVLIGVANVLDIHLLKNDPTVRTTTIFFYISNEGISLLKNASQLGLPIPNKLKNILHQLKK